ncbi:hypothetical protein [Nocardioides sp. AE5]|uniref:hypothetical protein n=1 Tax=Nocardioides sp. AE5 TaxID=2962573 RepID=UPI002881003C|nr:hypothetical protein [Nocardioides sp. AE5]MDT0201884.1 hypothetical protein [Nocardioides sp. AE5]
MDYLAHGVGGAKDLPLPAEYAVAGASAALAISFIVLALAWRTPRFRKPEYDGTPVPRIGALVDSTWFRGVVRALGFAFFVYVAAAAVFGKDLLINPVFYVFYVVLWVGIVPASLLFGPFYKAVSPVRTINLGIARLAGTDPDRGLFTYPARLGYWPAALTLFAFVWFELIYPFNAELGPLRLWCAVYVAAMLVGGALFGSTFHEHADPFEVFSTLVGRLSVWGRNAAGDLVVRNPLVNLDRMPTRPGLLAVCAVLLGSTAFDSFKEANTWLRFTQGLDSGINTVNLLALIGFIVAVGLLFAVAAMLTGVADGYRRTALPGDFAHSLVPILVGYTVAHYLSYFVEGGQQALILLSDPFSTGANLLGTANWEINYWLSYHPTFLATTKVLGVVIGHVVAVVAAHDRAIALLPRRHQLTGQLSMLVVMVGFTVGGLLLLFSS